MRITFEMLGEVQFSRELVRVGERAVNMREPLTAISHLWAHWNKEQFDSEGRRASGGWAPLAESTAAAKVAAGLDPRILHAHGELEKALTTDLEHHTIITNEFLHMLLPDEEGEPGHYGAFHQSGTSKMPQRRPVEFTEHDKIEQVKILQRWVMTGTLA